MGNFSRNTFDPVKDYVAVRLQQGVPVLDADWNELNDVTRQELYDGFALTFTDGFQRGGSDFEVKPRQEPNDFSILAGAALIQGRPIRVRQNLRYSTQPWTDPRLAARDGVAIIKTPLTTPTGPAGAPDRTDIVYLDVWDREVGSVEDANLINPAIGVETCLRLKREAAVRVTEGATTLPTNVPAGHVFFPLALLRRPVGDRQITDIKDIRPFFHSPQGTQVVSFFPAFLPITNSPFAASGENLPAWNINPSNSRVATTVIVVPKFHAFKTHNEAAAGILPLTLPDGARLTSLRISGTIFGLDGKLRWQLIRLNQEPVNVLGKVNLTEFFDILIEDTIRAPSTTEHVFGTTYYRLGTADPKFVIDNSRYSYILLARTFATPNYDLSIQGVSIYYEYFGLMDPPTQVQLDQPGIQRESVTVPQHHNSLVVRLQGGQRWVSVSTDTQQLVRNQSPDLVIAFTLSPGTYVVRTDGKIESLATESFRQEPSLFDQLRQGTPAFLTLTADAPDRHAVDGISEVVADGASYCTITVQKIDLNRVAVSGSEHEDELFLRTTGGVIMDDRGGQRIRSLKLRSGRAAFRLVSESSPKIVTVSVLSRDPLLSKAEIQIEFV
jgi:hypothetical protein